MLTRYLAAFRYVGGRLKRNCNGWRTGEFHSRSCMVAWVRTAIISISKYQNIILFTWVLLWLKIIYHKRTWRYACVDFRYNVAICTLLHRSFAVLTLAFIILAISRRTFLSLQLRDATCRCLIFKTVNDRGNNEKCLSSKALSTSLFSSLWFRVSEPR